MPELELDELELDELELLDDELALLDDELELLDELELPPGEEPPQPSNVITGAATITEPNAFTSFLRDASGVLNSAESGIFFIVS